MYSDTQAARYRLVNPWPAAARWLKTTPKWSDPYVQPATDFRTSLFCIFCCSNKKKDLLKSISHITVARTSNVSQSEIKYSILFGTSQSNSIFLPSIATERPSIWQLKDVLSSRLDVRLLSMLLVTHLLPLPQYKHYRNKKGSFAPLPHALPWGKISLSFQHSLSKLLQNMVLHHQKLTSWRKVNEFAKKQVSLFGGSWSYLGYCCMLLMINLQEPRCQ